MEMSYWDKCYFTDLKGTRHSRLVADAPRRTQRWKLKRPTSLFVAWLAAVRTRSDAADRYSLGRGVRDPTDLAGDRRDSSPRSVAAATGAEGAWWLGRWARRERRGLRRGAA